MVSLDDFKQKDNRLIISDAHADYLYEQSYGRQVEKMYDAQIKAHLEEEKKEIQSHQDYINKNYVRVGEC